MFQPCKWAIIRLSIELVRRLYNRCGDIVPLQFLWTTWWWPTYKAETCSCILHIAPIWYWVYVYIDIYTLCMLCVTCTAFYFLTPYTCPYGALVTVNLNQICMLLTVDWFLHIIVVIIFLFLSTWRWPHEWSKHIGRYYVIKLHS